MRSMIDNGIVKVSQTTAEGDYVTFFLRSDFLAEFKLNLHTNALAR